MVVSSESRFAGVPNGESESAQDCAAAPCASPELVELWDFRLYAETQEQRQY